jgi:hypothetical protein
MFFTGPRRLTRAVSELKLVEAVENRSRFIQSS